MPTAVMFGAGNVGRGFLGQLFSESGYEVIFVDVDQELVSALEKARSYPIHLVENEGTQKIEVGPVRALLAAQVDEVGNALGQASIAATAVGARVLPHIASLIAAGITKRSELNSRGADPGSLNIIVCENLHGAADTLRNLVASYVQESIRPYFDTQIGFVDTVIGRMVPPPTPEMRARDPRLIAVEPYKELPVDATAFVGPVPNIVGMHAIQNFGAFTARKLYIHNCGHAVLAYLGFLRGWTYGYEALEDPVIRPVFEGALAEAQSGIVAEYQVDPAWLEAHRRDLTHRFANRALGDTVLRLGRDPIRKLAANDRLVGAACLAQKAGVNPVNICLGIAAALHFSDPQDPNAVDLQQRLAKSSTRAVLAEISGIDPDDFLADQICQADLTLKSILQLESKL